MKKILQYPVAVLFGVFILVFFLVDVLNPDRSYSEFENTVLTTRPAFSISGFFDGSFGSNYVEYINDQIAGRDDWISLKAVADLLLGRVESHGVTFGDDSYMVEKPGKRGEVVHLCANETCRYKTSVPKPEEDED